MRTVKLFWQQLKQKPMKQDIQELEEKINEFLQNTDKQLVSFSIVEMNKGLLGSVVLTTLSQPSDPLFKNDSKPTELDAATAKQRLVAQTEVEETPSGEAPTVPALMATADGTKRVNTMAGAFGVPEGMKKAKDDAWPAPKPLLSPDFDIHKYERLFGNVN